MLFSRAQVRLEQAGFARATRPAEGKGHDHWSDLIHPIHPIHPQNTSQRLDGWRVL